VGSRPSALGGPILTDPEAMVVQAPPQRLATGRLGRAERQAKLAGAAAQQRQRRLDRDRIGGHAHQGAAERDELGGTPARLGQVAATEGVAGPPAEVPSIPPERPGLAHQARGNRSGGGGDAEDPGARTGPAGFPARLAGRPRGAAR
jgi:hypothetical protein